MSSNFF